MAKRTTRTCAHCELPSVVAVQARTAKGRVYLCMTQKCWDTYWASVPPTPPKKGKS